MLVAIKNLQKRIHLNCPHIQKITKLILQHEGIHQSSLSIVFVNSQKMRALNRKFLNRNYTTDVLAFDLRDDGALAHRISPLREGTAPLVGDVIISTDAAVQNARKLKTSLDRELTLYVIHGILHLMGFDDHGYRNIQRIRKKEQELLERLGMTKAKIVKPRMG